MVSDQNALVSERQHLATVSPNVPTQRDVNAAYQYFKNEASGWRFVRQWLREPNVVMEADINTWNQSLCSKGHPSALLQIPSMQETPQHSTQLAPTNPTNQSTQSTTSQQSRAHPPTASSTRPPLSTPRAIESPLVDVLSVCSVGTRKLASHNICTHTLPVWLLYLAGEIFASAAQTPVLHEIRGL